MSERPTWFELLRCVVCQGSLRESGRSLRCEGCDREYELTDAGIPVMLTPEGRETFGFGHDAGRPADLGEEYKERYRTNLGAKLWRALSPPQSVYVNPDAPPLFAAPEGVNLWLGGGGVDTGPFINVDIGTFYGVGLVADAARLPFADRSCDRVTCPALLEHVADPARVVQEAERVLKPEGVVEAVVPFCHPYHAYPADYSRFSKDGLRHLFRNFESIEIGIRTGPATTMLTFMTYYGKLLFPVHAANPILRWINRIIMGAFGWITYPIVHMDRWLNQLKDADVLANHFWVTARKPSERN